MWYFHNNLSTNQTLENLLLQDVSKCGSSKMVHLYIMQELALTIWITNVEITGSEIDSLYIWTASSPDRMLLDFCIWGYLNHRRNASEEVKGAHMSLIINRCRTCVNNNGRIFEHFTYTMSGSRSSNLPNKVLMQLCFGTLRINPQKKRWVSVTWLHKSKERQWIIELMAQINNRKIKCFKC